jgi:hypothetical protein
MRLKVAAVKVFQHTHLPFVTFFMHPLKGTLSREKDIL